jgi:hypothetical protein
MNWVSKGSPMANSYIPRADIPAAKWMQTFANGIALQPHAYQLDPVDASFLLATVNAFAHALAVTEDAAQRTSLAVCNKNIARKAAERLCQQYYSQIKTNAGVTDGNKIAIGVRPLNRSRQRIGCPQSAPRIGIVGGGPGRQFIRFGDGTTSSGSAKPFGAAFVELRIAVADGPVRDVNEATRSKLATRNPVRIGFLHKDDQKKATYFARWVSRRGETGDWSLPISMSIAA